MKLKLVVVDVELTRRQKRLMGGLAVGVVVLGGAAVAIAAVPKTFVSGETLTAADLNQNFTALDGRLNSVEASASQQTANGGYSLGATTCGATATTTADLSGLNAAGTGYAKARAACQAACGSTSAHMCTGEEVVRSEQLGDVVTNGWYSAGAFFSMGGENAYECSGWKSAEATQLGSQWTDHFPSADHCDQSWPVLCCD